MKRSICTCFLLLMLAPLASPACSQDYRLGPDDVLKITVYREEELDRDVRVSSDGCFSFPLLGKVRAEGLTVPELEQEFTEGLRRYIKKPQVTVFIKEYSTVSVTGQVNKPGSYPLRGEVTVMEAIGLAGGFTKIAAKNKVLVMRLTESGKKETITVRVSDISRRGDKSKDVALKRGDIVYIPESFF